jgi:LAO/AO transport system kinase
MQEHFCDEKVFIRSMGSRGALGGVSRATRGAIRLIGLLGYDYILVETVGIGQSESEIVSIADTTALVLMPNSGDDVQLMKAGVLQMADVYVVNKCDLSNPQRMISELKSNADARGGSGWVPPVLPTSAIELQGIEELVDAFLNHASYEEAHPDGRSVKRKRVLAEIATNLIFILEREVQKMVETIPDSEINAVQEGTLPAMVTANRLFANNFQVKES